MRSRRLPGVGFRAGGWGAPCGRGEGARWRGAQSALSRTFLCLSAPTADRSEHSLSAALTCERSRTVPSVSGARVVACELALGSRVPRRWQGAGGEGLLFLLLAFLHEMVELSQFVQQPFKRVLLKKKEKSLLSLLLWFGYLCLTPQRSLR